MMVFASWNGVRLVNEQVNVFYPPREERISHFRPGKDFLRISLLNAVLCFLALLYGWPMTIGRKVFALIRTIYSLLFFVINSMFVMTPIVYIYLSIGRITEKKKYNLHRMIRYMADFVLSRHGIPGIRYTQTNHCNEDFSKPSVIICNHQSHLDLIPLLAVSEKVIVLTADWVWNNPLYKYAIRNAEFLPASSGVENILPQLKSLVERGYSIAVYPEGTRSPDCSIGRFHQGAFYLAQTLDVDVLPLVLYGSGKALPKHGRLLAKWPMHMEIDPRISPERLRQEGTLRQQASYMRQYYKDRYAQLANRIEQNV